MNFWVFISFSGFSIGDSCHTRHDVSFKEFLVSIFNLYTNQPTSRRLVDNLEWHHHHLPFRRAPHHLVYFLDSPTTTESVEQADGAQKQLDKWNHEPQSTKHTFSRSIPPLPSLDAHHYSCSHHTTQRCKRHLASYRTMSP